VKLTIDHVIPTALGGTDTPDNLVTACEDCNQGKTSTAPDSEIVSDVADFDAAFRKAMERASDEDRRKATEARGRRDEFDRIWRQYQWKAQGDPTIHYAPRDAGWPNSIEGFTKAGLDMGDLADLVEVSVYADHVALADKWKYFCGCCWSLVRQRQDRALQILSDGFDPDSENWEAGE
jgi:hypothetical protein